MSWMRCGHVLMYFDALSTEYVFDDGKGIHDYGSSYRDNCTLVEILHGMVHEATGYEAYADKMLVVLANKLGVADKLRLDEEGNLKPLTFEEYMRLMDQRLAVTDPDRWREESIADAINKLDLDMASKPKALYNSKGGELKMTEEKKTRTLKEEPEEMPKSTVEQAYTTAIKTLKKDHNWKILVGMVVWWFIARLVYG